MIPAVANAIYDAVGVRITELPFTPEKILKALKEKAEIQMTTMPDFEVYIPSSLQDAVAFLGQNSHRARIVAGGTDLLPSLKQRLFEPQYLIDIKPLKEL